jgi:hypothetical protein
MSSNAPNLNGAPEQLDYLFGLRAIAQYLGVPERRCRYWLSNGALPVSRFGRTLVSSKATLRKCMGDILRGEAANGAP